MAVTAGSRLETLQIYKLLQCVRQEEISQISNLCSQGIPMLINYRDPKYGECALHLAAQTNNDKMIKFLLNIGAYPNVQDFKGRTPMMKAADYGHDKSVKVLAEAGADLSMQDNNQRDAIYYCFTTSTKRHRKCLDIILAHGANVNNTTASTEPVLVVACKNAATNEAMCMMLLEKGADPNACNKINGESALSMACSSGNVAVIKALLQKGANPNLMDRNCLVPMHYAAQRGEFSAVKSLMAYGADCSPSDKHGNNSLHFAAEGGFGMICKYLAQRGCDPKQKNTDGFTPRLLAKEKSFKEATKELRKAEKVATKQAKTGTKSPNDPSLLFLYDWTYERADIVKEALMKTVIPAAEVQDLKGNFVKKEDFDEVMKSLGAPIPDDIKKRMHEVHDKDRRGIIEIDEFISGKKYISKTSLMSAFEGKKKKGKKGKKGGKKGKKGKVKIPVPICTEKSGPRRPDGGPPYKFVEKQVQWTDPNRFNRDKPPKHPLQDDSAWYLQQPEKQYVNITDIVKVGDVESLKQAFQTGTEVDTRDKYYKTPLMTSCAEGNLEMTNFLLLQGASVEARDNFKWTPLHHACHSGQLDVVVALLYAGADGNAVTWNGATPLMRAIESCKTDVVKFLLDCNVNVIKVNKKEKTAVDVARDWGNTEIYNMVKEKYDDAPKPKKDKKGKMKTPVQKPITIPPIPLGHIMAPVLIASNQIAQPAEGEDPPKEQANKENVRSSSARPATAEEAPRDNNILATVDKLRIQKPEEIVYTPRKAWTEQPTTQALLDEKQEKRIRFGDDVDFDNFEKPLKQNMSKKIKEFNSQT